MSFKFISSLDGSRTAGDATALSGYNPSTGVSDITFGTMLYLQEKVVSFRLGNTGSSTATFTISIDSVNSPLEANTSLSLDKETYSSSVAVVVEPNKISPVIYMKHVVNIETSGATVKGLGTIKIKVVES